MPITRFVQHSLTNTEHTYDVTRHLVSGWVQDDWQASDRLTMNLGVRWDWDSNGNNESLEFRPWLSGDGTRANYNFAPRIGMNFRLNDRTVLRGGPGCSSRSSPTTACSSRRRSLCSVEVNYCARFEKDRSRWACRLPAELVRSGRPRTARSVGRKPTGLDAVSRACDVNNSAPGCVRRSLTQEINYDGRPPQSAIRRVRA